MSDKKILVVDDDPDVRQAMHIRLKANGYDTAFAMDVLTCVAQARRHQPHLIILDLGLPGGDGFVVMEQLRRQPALAVIPIIVVSGWDARGSQERVISAGARVYLQKPVHNAQLLAVMRQVLGESELPGDAGATGNWKLLSAIRT